MGKLMLVNPAKRKPAARKPAARRPAARKPAARKPAARAKAVKLRRRRRNPIAKRTLMASQITPAFTAATGALGLDIILGVMPIPETVKTGAFRHIVKGAGAIALGAVAANFLGKKTGEQMATGALTVVMHGAMKEVTQQMLPNIPLGYYSAGMPAGVGEYVDGMGAYLPSTTRSTYLDESLSTPFQGKSTTQMAEARMMAECDSNH